MESGYTRKRNTNRAKRKKRIEKANKITSRNAQVPALRGVAPDAEDPLKGLKRKTRQAITEAKGDKLAVVRMRELAPFIIGIGLQYRPFLPVKKEGDEPKVNARADFPRFMECMKVGGDLLKALAQYQSPKLSAVMMQQDERPTNKVERIRMTVNIFDQEGARVARYVDGAETIDAEVSEANVDEANMDKEEAHE